MIPLCCSPKISKKISALGARYDEKKKIFYIDNRHNRTKFHQWLPRYYRYSDKGFDVVKVYFMPKDSPAKNLKSLIGSEDFFLLKTKINEVNSGVCQFCGEIDNLWVIPVFRNNIEGKKIEQTLYSVLGGCESCAKFSLGIYVDTKKISLLNQWSEEETMKYFLNCKKKNENAVFEEYVVDVDKAYKLIGGSKE